MNKKKISIIVPVYNTEKYIEKCLDHLVNQTLEEIEIIIVNDGSPDNAEERIKKYQKKYPNKIIYVKILNGGVANARNVGLSYASGEYVGFCDSDDYLEEDMYELLYTKAKEENADIVVSGYFMENEETGTIKNYALDDLSFFGYSLNENPEMLLVSNPFITSKIFKRKMLLDNNIQFKKYRIFEDLLFTYSAMLKANRIEKVNKALYHYIRRKNESVTGTLNKKFYDLFPVMEELKNFYTKNTDVDFNEYLTFVAIHHAYLRFTPSVGFKKIGFKYKYIKNTYKFLDGYNKNWKKNIYFKLKNRQSSIYKSKFFWLLAPAGKRIVGKVKKVLRKTVRNYGHYYLKQRNKTLFNKAVLFDSQQGNDINGNMFYLIKELRKTSKYKNYEVYITVNKNRVEEFDKKLKFYNINNYNLIIRNSKKYIKILARAKYLFTDTSLPVYFYKRDEQIYVNTWHGTPLKYLGRSVAYEFYDISNVMKNFLSADYLLYPNQFMKKVMIKDYMLTLRKNKIVMNGYPRNIAFFESVKKIKKQKIAYLPTWRGNKANINKVSYIEELKNILDTIDKNLTENQEFYINLHPYLKGKLNISKYKNIKLFPKEYETYDFLNQCDILITDYSSVFFDYANTGKKIILFVYDETEYLKDRGMYLDIKNLPFVKVYNTIDLIKAINDNTKNQYKSFVTKYCKYDNKNNAKELLTLALENNSKNLEIVDNKIRKKNILIESNSYANYETYKELKDKLFNYTSKEMLWLGFLNSKIKNNKNFLYELKDTISYFGYFGSFNMTSLYDTILLALLKRKKELYKTYKKRFDFIFKSELNRRYSSVSFDKVLLYKENNIRNIYLYSYMDCAKILVIDKFPKVSLEILKKYDKIITTDQNIFNRWKKDIKQICFIDEINLNDLVKEKI